MLKKTRTRKNPLEARVAALEAQVEMLARIAFVPRSEQAAPAGVTDFNLGSFAAATATDEDEEPESDAAKALRDGWSRRMSEIHGDGWVPPERYDPDSEPIAAEEAPQ